MDQLHRTYIFKIHQETKSLQKLDFQCYNSSFYVSEEELSMLNLIFENNKNLILVRLPNIADSELIQNLFINCEKLTVLILCLCKQITDESALIISGTHQLYIKGPLRKVIKNKTKIHRNLKFLDVSNTSITINGRYTLQNGLKDCKIVF